MFCRPELSKSIQPIHSKAVGTITPQTLNAIAPPEFETTLQTTTIKLRQLLSIDRVAIFRFDPDTDSDGDFIAEDLAEGCASIMAHRVYDDCFGSSEQFAAYYHQGQVEAVADIQVAALNPEQVQMLSQFQVRASLVVPVFQEQQLWGLLCAHHCRFPRPWHAEEIACVQEIAKQFGAAIPHAATPHIEPIEPAVPTQTLPTVLTNYVDREQALSNTISKIRQCLEIDSLFQSVTTEVQALLAADRVAIFQFYPDQDWEGEFVSETTSAGWKSVLTERVYDHCFGEQFADKYCQGKVQAVSDIYAAGLSHCHLDILERFQVKANLIVPVLQREQLWGLLCVHQCEHTRQWTQNDIRFVQYIAEHLSIALQQLNLMAQLRYQTEQQKSLTGVITRIRESLDLETLFQTTAQEVRQLLKADRVGIFFLQREENWEGQFVAEDHGDEVSSILEGRVYDHCFGKHYATLYPAGHMYISNNIYESNLEASHIQTLEQFEIKANMVSPIMNGSELWGLLCIHHCQSPRQWQPSEIEFVDQIAKHFGVALEQWSQVEQLKLQAAQLAYISSRERALEQQQLLSQTINAIRDSLQLEQIFETTTKSIQSLFKTDRVVIYQFNADWSGRFAAESLADGWPGLNTEATIQDAYLMATQGSGCEQPLAVDDITQTDDALGQGALLDELQACAYAIAPITAGGRLWGLLVVCQNLGPRHWETDEIDFLARVSTQLGVAINQAEAVAQVKGQAAALQKATERQRALTSTIDKIRQSLDIDVIFTTTTHEVRQLLEVDRVAIYRFNADWSGAFVADSIVDSWQPAVPPQTIIQDVFSQPDQDGQLPRNEVFVPISQGEKLWGLLMVYQTSKPRYWDDDEVGLLAQVGNQLGVALQQAELLKTTQEQTDKLNQTLETLKSTQARLVQGEKMAGLGQLAAGIAHEINNPVGFISSNLDPMQEYINGLLDLVRLYQQQYPEPGQVLQTKIDEIEVDFILEDLPKIMTSMQMGTARIVDIVKSMQTFSRVDGVPLKNVDIHQGIDGALLILKHRLKAHNQRPTIKIVKSYGQLPSIQCYASYLNQVFMNILVNAVDVFDEDYTPSRPIPEIQISTRWQPEQDSLLIEFSDNGSGIPEAVLANIFNPFFTTKPVGKGTGLGLSISYQIVTEMHQGKLYCHSTLDEGTTFCIEIPATISPVDSE